MRRVYHTHIHLTRDKGPFPLRGPGWEFGSGKLPSMEGAVYIRSALPMDDQPSRIKHAMRLQADYTRPARVPVRELWSWQHYLDPKRVHVPLNPNAPPIYVAQLDGRLIVIDGNHRSSSAYAAGQEMILADFLNADDPALYTYRTDAPPVIVPINEGVELL